MALSGKFVRFIQYRIPKLKAGEYRITAALTAGPASAPVAYPAESRGFAVAAPRFRLGGDQLAALFPPNLAHGEFAGCLPHALLGKPVLPWLRSAYSEADKGIEQPGTPWLAVLTLQPGELPPPAGQPSPVVTRTLADLVPQGSPISVAGAAPLNPPVTGLLPPGVLSYPGLAQLDYGESPGDPVSTVDLPVALFARIAPTLADLNLLAHLRESDTDDAADSGESRVTRAVVLGNRCGAVGAQALALLVSLEQLSDCLPDEAGNPGPRLAGATALRLAVLASWSFTANAGGEHLEGLLRGLDADGLSALRLAAAPAAPDQVNQALADEAVGLTPGDAAALVANALNAGYVALGHHLRQAGQSVSWYRGPLLPYGPAAPFAFRSVTGPDALLRYDPQTGLFDTSYAAAWQLGQLLALRARGYAVALYQWKRQADRAQALAAEQQLLTQALPPLPEGGNEERGAPLFGAFFARRQAVAAPPAPPQQVVDFIAALRRLEGVPFGYLVPDERMLPPESLRLFTVDPNWIEALVDGAFSIGRSSDGQNAADGDRLQALRSHTVAAARARRRNRWLGAAPADPALHTISGFLLRSQAVRGWPQLQVDGYSSSDTSGPPDVPKLRLERLSADLLLCLFDGQVATVAIHEPPEQLHAGIEFEGPGGAPGAWTTLRAVSGDECGQQYPEGPPPKSGFAAIPLRGDHLTVRAAAAATAIQQALATQFGVDTGALTANEFALEMVKGVVRVLYTFGANSDVQSR